MSPGSPRGFTLIELLVVIAIIGILSSVVLASLLLARLRGADAAIKADLHTAQTHMEFYSSNNSGSYGTAMGKQSSPATTIAAPPPVNGITSDTQVKNALTAAIAQGGAGCWAVGVGGGSYAIAVPLKADSSHYWCIDSQGTAGTVLASDFAGPSCPASMGNGTVAAACPNP